MARVLSRKFRYCATAAPAGSPSPAFCSPCGSLSALRDSERERLTVLRGTGNGEFKGEVGGEWARREWLGNQGPAGQRAPCEEDGSGFPRGALPPLKPGWAVAASQPLPTGGQRATKATRALGRMFKAVIDVDAVGWACWGGVF